MRIACPSCAAEYEVPADRLPPGKLVRCARCGGEWMAVAEAEAAVPDAETPAEADGTSATAAVAETPALTAMERLAAAPPPRPAGRGGLLAAWLLTFLVLGGAVAATIAWRDDVVRLWPPSGRILMPHGHMAGESGGNAGKKAE